MKRGLGASLGVLVLAGCVIGANPTGSSLSASPSLAEASAAPSAAASLASPSQASASPTPSASAPTSSLAWHRLAAFAASDLYGVVGFANGYVALASSERTVWYSADGKAWQKSRLPFTTTKDRYGTVLYADAWSITTDGSAVLVVGGYAHGTCEAPPPPGQDTTGGGPTCPLAPVSWISSDGRTWRRSAPITPELAGKTEFHAAWPVPTGGWDAAACSWEGEVCAGRDLLHSPDGITWTSLPPVPDPGFERSIGVWAHEAVADATGGRLLWERSLVFDPNSCDESGGCSKSSLVATLWTSPDARAWTRMAGFPGADSEVLAGAAADGSLPWVLVGQGTSDATQPVPVAWSSADGRVWARQLLPLGSGSTVAGVTGFVRASLGYVAVSATNSGTLDARHETWLSGDGVTWTRLSGPVASGPDWGPYLVADGPAGVVGIGAWLVGDTYQSAVWQLR